MNAMSRIGLRFSRAGRKALPFLVRRRARLLPQSVAIADTASTAQDLGRGVRLEISLEEKNGPGWGDLIINAEGLAVILEGTLGASESAGPAALGDDITPAARALASTRLVIESVFANLKGQMRLERHLARTPAGLAVRIAQRILALTLGMLLNRLSGRPARALAAYDGR